MVTQVSGELPESRPYLRHPLATVAYQGYLVIKVIISVIHYVGDHAGHYIRVIRVIRVINVIRYEGTSACFLCDDLVIIHVASHKHLSLT